MVDNPRPPDARIEQAAMALYWQYAEEAVKDYYREQVMTAADPRPPDERDREVIDEHTNLGEPCEHCKHRFPYDECVVCGDAWPCETVRLRAEVDEKNREIEHLKA